MQIHEAKPGALYEARKGHIVEYMGTHGGWHYIISRYSGNLVRLAPVVPAGGIYELTPVEPGVTLFSGVAHPNAESTAKKSRRDWLVLVGKEEARTPRKRKPKAPRPKTRIVRRFREAI